MTDDEWYAEIATFSPELLQHLLPLYEEQMEQLTKRIAYVRMLLELDEGTLPLRNKPAVLPPESIVGFRFDVAQWRKELTESRKQTPPPTTEGGSTWIAKSK